MPIYSEARWRDEGGSAIWLHYCHASSLNIYLRVRNSVKTDCHIFHSTRVGCYTCTMKVTVFGASGKVGRQVVDLLVADNHEVVAFIHTHNPFADYPDVAIVSGSITDDVAVAKAVHGSQAVISCLGSWGTATKDIVSTGTRQIIAAMERESVSRIITVSGAGAFYNKDQPTALDRLTHRFLGIVAAPILRDGEEHLAALQVSGLHWTCLRSPVMTMSKRTAYRLSSKLPTLLASVPRAAVARALIDQLNDIQHFSQAPVIYRK